MREGRREGGREGGSVRERFITPHQEEKIESEKMSEKEREK